MLKIKTFVTSTTQDLDSLVNDFIENNTVHVEDIKFSTDGPRVGAMVIYGPKPKKDNKVSVS